MICSPLPYHERASLCEAVMGQRLLSLIDDKKTNLALSADVTTSAELLALAREVGSEICVLKTHIDIIQDFSKEIVSELATIAKQQQFFIFEDRKFADIGHTVKHQYEGGIYHIADWAHFINAHALPGPGIIQGLAEAGLKNERGLILIAEMSSKGHLMSAQYIAETLRMAQAQPQFVMGFITQHALSTDPRFLHFTPGVKIETGGDTLGQQYVSPRQAILEHGADVIIVGRGILSAPLRLKAASLYRQQGWEAYQERLQLI